MTALDSAVVLGFNGSFTSPDSRFITLTGLYVNPAVQLHVSRATNSTPSYISQFIECFTQHEVVVVIVVVVTECRFTYFSAI